MALISCGLLHSAEPNCVSVQWQLTDAGQRLRSLRRGESLCSPIFDGGNNRWMVKLKANQNRRSEADDVGVFLTCLPLKSVELKVGCRLDLLGDDGDTVTETHFTKEFPVDGQMEWGRAAMFKLKQLGASGSMRLRVQLDFDPDKDAPGHQVRNLNFTSEVSDYLGESLFNKKDFSDVRVKCGKVKIYAHRCILARSSFFRAKMDTRTILIKGKTDPKVVVEFVRFIYSGRCQNLNKLAPEIYRLARDAREEQMESYCLDFMMNNLRRGSAGKVYKLAKEFQLKRLIEAAREFLRTHISAIDDVIN